MFPDEVISPYRMRSIQSFELGADSTGLMLIASLMLLPALLNLLE
jgi:hypothetical protein